MGIPSLLLLNQEPIGIYIKVDRYIFLEEVCGSEVPASKSGGGGGGASCTFTNLDDHARSSYEEYSAKGGNLGGGVDGEIHSNMTKLKTTLHRKQRRRWVSERAIMMKMMNMYFTHEESTCKKTSMEWGMGLVVWEVNLV